MGVVVVVVMPGSGNGLEAGMQFIPSFDLGSCDGLTYPAGILAKDHQYWIPLVIYLTWPWNP